MSSEVTEESLRRLMEVTWRPRLSNESYDMLKIFVEWLASLGLRPSTRYRYVEVVGAFLMWLDGRGLRPENLNLLTIERFFSHVRERGVKPGTLHWYVVGVKKFLKFLYHTTDEEKYRKLYEKVKVPRIQRELPEILSFEEVIKLLEAFDSAKHRALYALIYETGCRISEALSLKIKDLEFDEYGVRVYFRKSKSEARVVRVSVFARDLLAWLELHKARSDPEAYVFYGRDPYKRMSRSNAFCRLKEAARRAGIKKDVHPHMLRHTRATELYRVFKELEMMRWFGWRTRKMIDVYSKITQEDVELRYLKHVFGDRALKKEVTKENRGKACPRCGALCPPNALFCHRCGLKLSF